MARYAVEANRTLSASLSVGSIVSAATVRRIELYEFIFGAAEATPADAGNLWQVGRITAAGTSTAVTPSPLDAAEGAALTVAGENHTIEATYTAGLTLLSIGLNQRATFRWVAAPGGELIGPATSAAGFGVRTPTAGGLVAATALLHFIEH